MAVFSVNPNANVGRAVLSISPPAPAKTVRRDSTGVLVIERKGILQIFNNQFRLNIVTHVLQVRYSLRCITV